MKQVAFRSSITSAVRWAESVLTMLTEGRGVQNLVRNADILIEQSLIKMAALRYHTTP